MRHQRIWQGLVFIGLTVFLAGCALVRTGSSAPIDHGGARLPDYGDAETVELEIPAVDPSQCLKPGERIDLPGDMVIFSFVEQLNEQQLVYLSGPSDGYDVISRYDVVKKESIPLFSAAHPGHYISKIKVNERWIVWLEISTERSEASPNIKGWYLMALDRRNHIRKTVLAQDYREIASQPISWKDFLAPNALCLVDDEVYMTYVYLTGTTPAYRMSQFNLTHGEEMILDVSQDMERTCIASCHADPVAKDQVVWSRLEGLTDSIYARTSFQTSQIYVFNRRDQRVRRLSPKAFYAYPQVVNGRFFAIKIPPGDASDFGKLRESPVVELFADQRERVIIPFLADYKAYRGDSQSRYSIFSNSRYLSLWEMPGYPVVYHLASDEIQRLGQIDDDPKFNQPVVGLLPDYALLNDPASSSGIPRGWLIKLG